MDVREMARDERADLATLLRTLSPEQWETPSLCEGWRVRDVVGHVISFDEMGFKGVLPRLLRARFSPDRFNAAAADAAAARSPEDLLSSLERHLDPRGFLSLLGGMPAFFDAFVHHQDIRRPLGLPRAIPTERLIQALRVAFLSPSTGGRKRGRGLRFAATDNAWSKGEGPEVAGPAEAIVMAVAGRRGVVDELSGPGQPILSDRIGR